MKRLILATAISLAATTGAFAQTEMTCAQFSAMAPDAQSEAIADLATKTVAGQGMSAAEANISRDGGATDDPKPANVMAGSNTPGQQVSADENPDMARAVADVCAANPSLTVSKAMVSL